MGGIRREQGPRTATAALGVRLVDESGNHFIDTQNRTNFASQKIQLLLSLKNKFTQGEYAAASLVTCYDNFKQTLCIVGDECLEWHNHKTSEWYELFDNKENLTPEKEKRLSDLAALFRRRAWHIKIEWFLTTMPQVCSAAVAQHAGYSAATQSMLLNEASQWPSFVNFIREKYDTLISPATSTDKDIDYIVKTEALAQEIDESVRESFRQVSERNAGKFEILFIGDLRREKHAIIDKYEFEGGQEFEESILSSAKAVMARWGLEVEDSTALKNSISYLRDEMRELQAVGIEEKFDYQLYAGGKFEAHSITDKLVLQQMKRDGDSQDENVPKWIQPVYRWKEQQHQEHHQQQAEKKKKVVAEVKRARAELVLRRKISLLGEHATLAAKVSN